MSNMSNLDLIYNELLFEYNHGGINPSTVARMGLTNNERRGLLRLLLAQTPSCSSECEVSHSTL
jgi:hypothetical protein